MLRLRYYVEDEVDRRVELPRGDNFEFVGILDD
jgi:hypothetical protein